MAALPANVATCLVTGKFTAAVIDGPDPDHEPDAQPLAGLTVRFTADLKPAIVRNAYAETIHSVAEIIASTDDDGVLVGLDGVAGVRLIASDDPDLEPTGWTWKVTISGAGFPTSGFSFVAPSGGEVKLASVIPVPASPGNQIPEWQSVVTTVTDARDVTIGARDDALDAKNAVEAVVATNDGIMTTVAQDENSTFRAELDATITGATQSAARLPNESPFWYNTQPVSYKGRIWASTAGTDRDVWLQEWTQPHGNGTPYWLQRTQIGWANDAGQDDHYPGVIVAREGRPMLVFYTGHAFDNTLKWRATTKNIEDIPVGGVEFGDERQYEITSAEQVCYPLAYAHGETIWILHRTGWRNNKWALTRISDWGTGTPTTVDIVTSTDQMYVMGRLVGDKFRMIVSDHPDSADTKVWYMQVDVVTGNVERADGTVLGNLDGTNLPLPEASLEEIYASPAGEKPWTYDVGDGVTPEVVFVSGSHGAGVVSGQFPDDSRYLYGSYRDGAWSISTIHEGIGHYIKSTHASYFPSIAFYPGETGAVALARESGGTYYLSRFKTTNWGASWTETVLSTSEVTLSRPFPVRQIGTTPRPAEVLGTIIHEYPSYFGKWECEFRPLPLSIPAHAAGDRKGYEPPRRPQEGVPIAGPWPMLTMTGLTNPPGGFRLEADVQLDSWASGQNQILITKEGSNTTRGPGMQIGGDGKLQFTYSLDGSTQVIVGTAASLGLRPGERAEVAITIAPTYTNGTQHRLKFMYRRGGPDRPWTYVGSSQNVPALTLYFGTDPWEVGSKWGGTTQRAAGTLYRAGVYTHGGSAALSEWRADRPGSTTSLVSKGTTWKRYGNDTSNPYSRVGLWLPGTSGNYLSSPDSADAPTSGTIILDADLAMADWSNGAANTILAKESTTSTRSIRFFITGDGKPSLSWSADGSAVVASPAIGTPLPFADGQRMQVRIVLICDNGGTYRYLAYYRAPGASQWTLHGSSSGTTVTSVSDSTSPWEIGSRFGGTADPFLGTIYSVSLKNASEAEIIGWTAEAGPLGPYRDRAGHVWTRNGSGSIATS